MSISEVATRVSYADEIRKSKRLSEMMQRELKSNRAKDIANYLLSQDERFFNSLVVAVYRGNPAWHEFGNITPYPNADIDADDLPDETKFSIGFLSFTGKERLFAIDGQHRLAGMKRVADENEDDERLADQVPVILVAHEDTAAGLTRTRRLFTTLNKNAKPVSKGETIALDEDDVMAICVRRLVEDHDYFKDDRISYKATSNLAPNDLTSLTTIGNLYDVLGVLFSNIKDHVPLKELQFNRPDDDALNDYYDFACDYFDKLANTYESLQRFFRATQITRVVKKYRGSFGGSVLFRPVGLRIITEVIVELCKKTDMDDAIRTCGSLPEDLSELPFEGLIWDSSRSRMATPLRGALTRDLLLFILDAKPESSSLRNRYAAALGQPGEGAALLEKLRS